ncbi:GRF1-interacting factor 2-like [Cornus florida]|uniref:GRF1-interacting factor 2-like n=1 Tax=Cornus florida TaxID=4283 RepID=UPI00289ED2C2|nr:GRF1-interacting factor 2-like [Cornus florida]
MQQQTLITPSSFSPNNITTEQIQKYLDENKNLILAILEYQKLGKLAECAQYQAQLQKNLMYLAAIADAQPQAPTVPSQTPSHPVVQQGHQMQQPQAAAVQQQMGVFASKLPFQLGAHQSQDQQYQQQHQLPHFQQQQFMQGHAGMRPTAINDMHQAMHGGLGISRGLVDAGGSRQDGSEAGSGDGQGKSASGRDSGE